MARPIVVASLLAQAQGSPLAISRAAAVLDSIAGVRQHQEAAAGLDVSPQRLHEIRADLVQAMVVAAEPKPAGRPPAPPVPEELTRLRAENEDLKRRLKDMEIQRHLERLREEMIAAGMHGRLKGISKKRRP
jgi:hypothetical protein